MQQNLPKPNSEELKAGSSSIGYTFKNPKLLQQALTRKSAILEGKQTQSVGHNERLEFFGDSILRTVVDDYLLERHPDYNEDQLSEARDTLVSKQGCVIAWEREYMRMKLYEPPHSPGLISYSNIIRFLLAYGGDVTLKDPTGKCAVDLTQEPSLQQLLSPSVEHKHVKAPIVRTPGVSVSQPPPSPQADESNDGQNNYICLLS
jgi:Ribonuclease-III-like